MKDDNGYPIIYGVSHLDGRTPIRVRFNATTRGMLTDTTTTISFDPNINASQTDDDFPIAKATSSTDDETVKPWVVHATTGAVLIDE